MILSRVVAKFSTTWVQSDLMSSILMNSNIYKETVITKDKRQVMILQRMGSYLKNGRVEKVVTIIVWDERINHGREEVALQIQGGEDDWRRFWVLSVILSIWYTLIPDLDDVSVVEFVLQGDDLPHEAKGTELVIPRSIYTNVNTASRMPGISYLQEGVSGLDQDQDSPQQVLSIFACSLWPIIYLHICRNWWYIIACWFDQY